MPALPAAPAGLAAFTALTAFAATALIALPTQRAQSSDLQVSTTQITHQYVPAVGLDAAGGFWVTWSAVTADADTISPIGKREVLGPRARSFGPDGVPAREEFVPAIDGASNLGPGAVGVQGDGGALLVWATTQPRPDWPAPFQRSYDLWAQFFGPEQLALAPPERVNIDLLWMQEPFVAADREGNYAVAWTSGDSRVWLRTYTASAGRFGDLQAMTLPRGEYRYWVADVALSRSGRGVIVCEFMDANNRAHSLTATTFDRAGAQTSGNVIAGRLPGLQAFNGRVAMDDAGNFVLVWESRGGIPDGIYARRFPAASGELSEPVRVDEDIRIWGEPDVAVAPDGRFVVVWGQQNEGWTSIEILGRIYHADGTPASPRFQVNQLPGGWKGRPSVAINAAGQIVVAWDGDGIFARTFPAVEVAAPTRSIGSLKAGFRGRSPRHRRHLRPRCRRSHPQPHRAHRRGGSVRATSLARAAGGMIPG